MAAPTFPIVLGTDGSTLAALFNGYSVPAIVGEQWSNLGGVTWVVNPDRSYTQIDSYEEDPLTTGIQTAVDNLPVVPIWQNVSLSQSGIGIVSAKGSGIRFTVNNSGVYEVSLFAANGKCLSMKKVNCAIGLSHVDFGTIANGSYLVRIKGNGASLSSVFCVSAENR